MMSVGLEQLVAEHARGQRSRRKKKAAATRAAAPTTTVPVERVEALDLELASVARSAGALRLAIGDGLEALARRDGHHCLGFPSMAAYVLERCERKKRWMQESCWLARRLRELPQLSAALTTGEMNWSMAAVVARIATADDEEKWLLEAATSTVRALRKKVRQLLTPPVPCATDSDGAPRWEPEEMCALTVTADVEDVGLLECVSLVVDHIGGSSTADDVVQALVGEAVSSLVCLVPKDALDEVGATDDQQRAYEAQRAEWRDEAEARCEPRLPRGPVRLTPLPYASASDFSGSPESIDHHVSRMSAALAERDVIIGQLADALFRTDGWRRLGYATAKQYAEERLGMSHTSLKEKRTLAHRLGRLPHLGATLRSRKIGYEAARLVTLVATPHTDEPWAARAAARTVRHLREEVNVALFLSRVTIDDTMNPPTEDEVRDFHRLKARIVTGADLDRSTAPPTPESRISASIAADRALAVLREHFERQRRTPRRLRSRGRETVRLRVTREMRDGYRELECVFNRYRPLPMSFVRFACNAVLESWAYALRPVAYGHIYERDGFVCSNPMCSHRHLTPHHVVYRVHGGTDADDNIVSLCLWCHLDGVHGGRITARHTTKGITWHIGRIPHTVVEGRTRTRLQMAA